MLLDEERVCEVLGPSTWLSVEEFEGILATANADPDEGIEWLPWYKLSLGLLMNACGALTAAVDEAIKAIEPNDPELARKMRDLRFESLKTLILSLRASGTGPSTDPEHIAKTEASIDTKWRPLMEDTPND